MDGNAGSAADGPERVRSLLDQFVRAGEVDGAAVAIAWQGRPLLEYAAGAAAPGRAAAADTLWPLASISKSYTASTVMALVERGVLTLDTLVCSVLPAFAGDGRERVTLRHLLTHTSGLVYESPEMEQRLRDRIPLDALVDEAQSYPLLFPPGARVSYSDYGYALAGRMAAAAAGQPFPRLVHDLLLRPAGLDDTFFPPPSGERARLAHVVGSQAYGTEGAMYNSAYALDLAHPAFGVVATVGDLLRFGLLFAPGAGGGVLARATASQMISDQNPGHVPGSAYDGDSPARFAWGLGFFLKGRAGFGPDLASPACFGHDGASGCGLWVDPLHEVAVAFVSNRHVNTGRAAFRRRITAVGNAALAALTRAAAAT